MKKTAIIHLTVGGLRCPRRAHTSISNSRQSGLYLRCFDKLPVLYNIILEYCFKLFSTTYYTLLII